MSETLRGYTNKQFRDEWARCCGCGMCLYPLYRNEPTPTVPQSCGKRACLAKRKELLDEVPEPSPRLALETERARTRLNVPKRAKETRRAKTSKIEPPKRKRRR